VEPEQLYIVQEYVEGEDFAALLQTQQSAYQVAEMGMQICQALIYAGGGARKACHGDLLPTAIIRDRRGQIRINNFGLPSDIYYFTSWSVVGGDGRVVSDRELPWGKISDGRKEDDTRAVGLLMYQLLMSRAAGVSSVEPPTDGRLRFTRNVPAELCEIVAQAIIRQHPQHINNPEDLYKELKALLALLEPPVVEVPVNAYPAARVNEMAPAQAFSGAGQQLSPAVGYRDANMPMGQGMQGYGNEAQGIMTDALGGGGASDLSLKMAAARQAAYPQEGMQVQPRRGVNLPILLLFGIILFALFFVVGYFVANFVIH